MGKNHNWILYEQIILSQKKEWYGSEHRSPAPSAARSLWTLSREAASLWTAHQESYQLQDSRPPVSSPAGQATPKVLSAWWLSLPSLSWNSSLIVMKTFSSPSGREKAFSLNWADPKTNLFSHGSLVATLYQPNQSLIFGICSLYRIAKNW